MTISQQIALQENVSGPAKAAASGVNRLTKALTKLFSVEGNDNAASRVQKLAGLAGGIGGGGRGGANKAANDTAKLGKAREKAAQAELAAKLRLDRTASAFKAKREKAEVAETSKLEKVKASAKAKADKLTAASAAKAEKEKVKSKAKSDKETKRIDDIRKGDGGVGDALGGVGLAVGAAALAGIAAMAMAVKDLLVGGAKFAVAQTDFRENAIITLQAMVGTQAKASALYEKILDAADEMGMDKGEAISRIATMMANGFDEGTAIGVTKAIANMQALGPMGAKMAKKFNAEVQEAYKKGGPAAVQKLIDAHNKSDIGQLGEKQGKTFSRTWGDVIGRFERIFDSVDISPLKNALSSVVAAFSGPAGERMKNAVNKLFGGIFKALFGDIKEGDVSAIFDKITKGVEEATPTIIKLAEAIRDSGPAVLAFAGGLGEGLKKAADAALVLKRIWTGIFGESDSTSEAAGGVDLFAAALRGLGSAISQLAAGLFSGGLTLLIDGLVGSFEFAKTAIEMQISAFHSLGSRIVQGIAQGITDGASAVVSAIVNTVTMGVAAGNATAQVRSPSKVFAEMGGYMSQGMAQGITGGAPAVAAATSGVVGTAVGAARAPSFAGGAVAGGAGGGGININVNISGMAAGGDPAAVGAVIGAEIERRVAAMQRRRGEMHSN